jgi:hypothetical protein
VITRKPSLSSGGVQENSRVADQGELEEKSVEGFGHRPRKPGGWKEDLLPKGED